MIHTALIPFLDPESIIAAAGPWALLVVCFIVFAETGLLVGFLLPGDTLLVISGLLSNPELVPPNGVFGVSVWIVALLIAVSAFLGGEVGYEIGHRGGPKVFERKESGLFSVKNVERTNAFFERFGGLTIILARFVPIVRTFAPVAAGVGHMHRAKYSLYNFIGAVLWGFGLTMFGYLVSFIPPVATLVRDYIDVILLIAVGGTALITALALLQRAAQGEEGRGRRRGRRSPTTRRPSTWCSTPRCSSAAPRTADDRTPLRRASDVGGTLGGMSFLYEEKASTSPFVDVVWHTVDTSDGTYLAAADACWDMIFTRMPRRVARAAERPLVAAHGGAVPHGQPQRGRALHAGHVLHPRRAALDVRSHHPAPDARPRALRARRPHVADARLRRPSTTSSPSSPRTASSPTTRSSRRRFPARIPRCRRARCSATSRASPDGASARCGRSPAPATPSRDCARARRSRMSPTSSGTPTSRTSPAT